MTKSSTFLYASESVGKGHPDKLCDQIPDKILDAYISKDPNSRVAVECVATQNTIFVFGEVCSCDQVNVKEHVVEVVREAGYDDANFGMDYKTVNIIENIAKQSDDIYSAVEKNKVLNRSICERNTNNHLEDDEYENIGAGDQGIMFGYATNETEERMPVTLLLANKIVRRMDELRGKYEFIKSDCKSQVTVEYEKVQNEFIPLKIDNIVLSVQHSNNLNEYLEVMK